VLGNISRRHVTIGFDRYLSAGFDKYLGTEVMFKLVPFERLDRQS